MSCTTSPPSAPEIVEVPVPYPVIEYRDRPLPAIDWPPFPDPSGAVELLPDGRVALPLELWLDITRYVIDVEAGIDRIEAYRDGPE